MSDLDVLVPTARARDGHRGAGAPGLGSAHRHHVGLHPYPARRRYGRGGRIREVRPALARVLGVLPARCRRRSLGGERGARLRGRPDARARAGGPAPARCVNGSRRARRPNLLWIPDALRLVEAGGIDWPRLLAQAAARRFSLRARTMLGYLRRAFDAIVPDEAIDGLRAIRVCGLSGASSRRQPAAGSARRAAELLVQLPPPERRDGPRVSVLPAADVEGAEPRRDSARRARRARGSGCGRRSGRAPSAERARQSSRASASRRASGTSAAAIPRRNRPAVPDPGEVESRRPDSQALVVDRAHHPAGIDDEVLGAEIVWMIPAGAVRGSPNAAAARSRHATAPRRPPRRAAPGAPSRCPRALPPSTRCGLREAVRHLREVDGGQEGRAGREMRVRSSSRSTGVPGTHSSSVTSPRRASTRANRGSASAAAIWVKQRARSSEAARRSFTVRPSARSTR